MGVILLLSIIIRSTRISSGHIKYVSESLKGGEKQKKYDDGRA